MVSFIFDATKGGTPEALARQREIAAAIMLANRRTPQNIGEGLGSIADVIVAKKLMGRADEGEAAGREQANAAFNPIVQAMGGYPSSPSAGGMSTPPRSPMADNPSRANVGSTIDFSQAQDSAPSGPALAGNVRGGKGWTEIVTADGKTIRREGARNWRNNNPGNIEYGDFARNAGAIGSDGRFAVFPTYEAGRAAKAKLLFESPNYRDKTISAAINRYAPPFENNTNAYTSAVASAIGVDPNTPISALSPQQRNAMLDAMQKVEGFRPGREFVNGGAQTASLDAAAAMAGPAVDAAPAPPVAAAVPPQPAPVQTAGLMMGTPEDRIRTQVPIAGQTMPMQPPAAGAVPMPQAPQVQPGPQMPSQAAPVPAGGLQQVAQAMQQRQPMSPQEEQGMFGPDTRQGPPLDTLMRAASDPWLSEGQRGIVNVLMQQRLQAQQQAADPAYQMGLEKQRLELDAMRNPQPKVDFITGKDGSIFQTDSNGGIKQVYGGKPDLPTNVQEYEYARQQGYQGTFSDFQLEQKKAGASQVNIDQRAEGAFEKKLAEGQAEQFNTMATEGMAARADIGVINGLDELLKGQGGVMTGLQGWLAQRGVDVGPVTSDLQAAQALINKLVPTQRQPGSGSMSDRDVELFTRSLPSLWNQPGGNQIIIRTMRGLAQYKQAQGEIADMVMTGDMSRQEARRALRDLPNPLADFSKAQDDGTNAIPEGIDPQDWEFLTPEERKLFQ